MTHTQYSKKERKWCDQDNEKKLSVALPSTSSHLMQLLCGDKINFFLPEMISLDTFGMKWTQKLCQELEFMTGCVQHL